MSCRADLALAIENRAASALQEEEDGSRPAGPRKSSERRQDSRREHYEVHLLETGLLLRRTLFFF